MKKLGAALPMLVGFPLGIAGQLLWVMEMLFMAAVVQRFEPPYFSFGEQS